jgi:hypothetical protein
VNRLVGDERAYHVFEELNTYTAVVYSEGGAPHPAAARLARRAGGYWAEAALMASAAQPVPAARGDPPPAEHRVGGRAASRGPRLRAGRSRDHRDAEPDGAWFIGLAVAIFFLIGALAWMYQI